MNPLVRDTRRPLAVWGLSASLAMTAAVKLVFPSSAASPSDFGAADAVVGSSVAAVELLVAAAVWSHRLRGAGILAAACLTTIFAGLYAKAAWTSSETVAHGCGCLGSAPLSPSSRGVLIAALAAAVFAASLAPAGTVSRTTV